MLAAIEMPDKLCIVRWTGRVRLHVEVLTVCGAKLDAADGVVQVPDYVLNGRPVISISDFGGKGQRPLKICAACGGALAAALKG
jgi:hypothetical protein